MVVLPSCLHNAEDLRRRGHRAEGTAVPHLVCPGILESYPVHGRQDGNDRAQVVISHDSNAVREALSSSAHRRDIFGLSPILTVIEIAKEDGMFFKVFEQLELLHGTQSSTLM